MKFNKYLYTIPFVLMIASFGPYVYIKLGLRMEHLFIYLLASFALFDFIKNQRKDVLLTPLNIILFSWIFITIWTLIITFIGDPNYGSIFKVMSHLENYTQPIAVILIIKMVMRFISMCRNCNNEIASVVSLPRNDIHCEELALKQSNFKKNADLIFNNLCQLLILLMLIHTIFVVLAVPYNLSNIVKPFVGGRDGMNLWIVCDSVGRHIGIFSQPIESGVLYSFAIIIWTYLARKKQKLSVIDYLSLLFLLLGGLLSASKIFIVGGVFVFILYWLSGKKYYHHLLNLKFVFAGLFFILFTMNLFNSWKGMPLLKSLFYLGWNPHPNVIANFTGSRFCSKNSMFDGIPNGTKINFGKSIRHNVNNNNNNNNNSNNNNNNNDNTNNYKKIITGLGFASITTMDNELLSFYIQGGAISVAGYLLILSSLFYFALINFKKNEEGKLLLFVFILLLGSSLGAPILTMNRFAPIFWMFFVMIHNLHDFQKNELK